MHFSMNSLFLMITKINKLPYRSVLFPEGTNRKTRLGDLRTAGKGRTSLKPVSSLTLFFSLCYILCHQKRFSKFLPQMFLTKKRRHAEFLQCPQEALVSLKGKLWNVFSILHSKAPDFYRMFCRHC